MTEQKQTKTVEKKHETKCNDRCCPKHGEIAVRGRSFRGTVITKFPKRVCIEFDRTLFVKKYERYSKRKTKLHARLPDCMAAEVNIGDYIEITECRPISKIIHFIVTKKIHGAENSEEKKQ